MRFLRVTRLVDLARGRSSWCAMATNDNGSSSTVTSLTTLCQSVPNKVVVNVVGSRNTTVSSSEHGKIVHKSSQYSPEDFGANKPTSYIEFFTNIVAATSSVRNIVTPPVTVASRSGPTAQSMNPVPAVCVEKTLNFNAKIFNPLKKKDFETCILREVTKDDIITPTLMQEELLKQLCTYIHTPVTADHKQYIYSMQQ